MSTRFFLASLSALTLGLLAHLPAQAQSATETPGPAASASTTLSSSLGLVSDYRFRGISQSWRQPAVQAGSELAHASGLYLGGWGSSVSANSYNNGAGLELDLYGGYRTSLGPSLQLDLGALAYVYPSARMNQAPAQPGAQRYDNLELYAGLSQGALSAKLSVATTDYFGLNGRSAGYAYFQALGANGSSRGSAYLDLNYGLDLGAGLSANAHLGQLWVRRYSALSYTDWKLGLSQDLQTWGLPAAGFSLGLALVGSDADSRYYQAGDSAGQRARRLGRSGVVLSLGRNF